MGIRHGVWPVIHPQLPWVDCDRLEPVVREAELIVCTFPTVGTPKTLVGWMGIDLSEVFQLLWEWVS